MLEIRVLSAVAKAFPTHLPEACAPRFSGLRGEVISFQTAFRFVDEKNSGEHIFLRLEIDSPAKEFIRARRVKWIPVRQGALPDADANYLNGGAPGLYPDPLIDLKPHNLRAFSQTWESVWFDFQADGTLPAGDIPVTLRFFNEENDELEAETALTLHLIDAELPEQTLLHTKWFHCDCLADYYGVEVFSERHWQIIENYVRCAAEHGINTLLTPTHTPPLDTRVGTYRPTVQLVDVTYIGGEYSFGFEKLRRWVEMAQRCGIKYFEIAHLFSQWGARFAPQIVARTEDGMKRIFGWDTPSLSDEYRRFIDAYIPALVDELESLGIADKTMFHISDEPGADSLENYLAGKEMVQKHLRGQIIIDALSDPAFYDSGAVTHPVPANSHIEPFLERKIPDLWTYYCCGQGVDVSNLLVAMPGSRTRVFGAQLYKFGIKGILHWGFNFYYSQYSDYLIDPWTDTDGDGFAQAGDAFQVYPDRNGMPVDSMRLMLVQQATQDHRAMQLLERLSDRETVLKLIDEGIEPIRFNKYPAEDSYILGLRERINAEIEKRL